MSPLFPGNLRRLVVALLLVFTVETVSAQAQEKPLVLVGGTVFPKPGVTPIEDAVLVLRNGQIAAVGPRSEERIPPNAKLIDARGRFLTAGYWNAHVHFTKHFIPAHKLSDAELGRHVTDMFLRWGFVNVVDVGSWLENTLAIRRRIESGDVSGPRIITAGSGFAPLDASPYYIKPRQLPELANAAQARSLVTAHIASGADLIKLFTGSWATPMRIEPMPLDVVRAAVDAAHERGILVFAHPSNSTGARVAIEGGVDVLAHTFPNESDGPWDRSLPAAMARRGMALVPTLKLWRRGNEQLALAQLRAIHEAGVPILFGTDVGYMRDSDTTEEFRLMALAGMDHAAILASLTTAPAERFGFADRAGRLMVGYEGDVVVLAADPRDDPTAFAKVEITIRRGQVVYSRNR